MGIVLAFIVGYVVGARSGQEELDRLVVSLREVRDSAEFRGLVSGLRAHASHALQDLSVKVADGDGRITMQDVLGRAKEWIAQEPTSGES